MENKTKLLYLVGSIVLALFLSCIISYFRSPRNVVISAEDGNVVQKSEIIKINDSVKGIQQEILLTNDKEVVARKQDSIQMLLNKLAGIKPILSIQYKELYKDSEAIGTMKYALSEKIDSLLAMKDASEKDNALLLEKYKKDLYSQRIPYKIVNKYRQEGGTIGFDGSVISDSLLVTSEPLITIGEKNRFLKRSAIMMTVGNANPYITSSNARSVMYVPKSKLQVSAGPMVLTNGKQVSAGLGIVFKKGLFSVSAGYQLVNTK